MTTINYYQKLTLDSLWKLLSECYYSLQPDIYIDALDYAYQCGEEDDFFEDYVSERYWLLKQKIFSAAILKLADVGLLSPNAPKSVLKESLSMPGADDYWTLIDTAAGLPLGLGLPGTAELQRYLYSLAGWDTGEAYFYVSDPDIYMEYCLFHYVLDTFPRKCWGKIITWLQQQILYHLEQNYLMIHLHYKDLDFGTIKYYYSDLISYEQPLFLPDEEYIIYFLPVDRYPTINLESGTDFSSLNLAGALLAYKNSRKELLSLPHWKGSGMREWRDENV